MPATKPLQKWIPPVIWIKGSSLINEYYFQRYKSLVSQNKKFKDIHSGKRCFIIGSGASIQQQDLTRLSGEIVFSLNNFFVHPDCQTVLNDENDKYHLIAPIHPPQTDEIWREWFQKMNRAISPNVQLLAGLNLYSNNMRYLDKKSGIWEDKEVHYFYSGVKIVPEIYKYKKSHLDISKRVWMAGAASIYAMIYARYMGIKEIYLLGMDMNYFNYTDFRDSTFYKQNAVHLKSGSKVMQDPEDGISKNTRILEGCARTFYHYSFFKKYSPEINIINCSPISLIDVFEKQEFENIPGLPN